jgi:ribosomal protein S18 acetylase RimI-like enzyme
MAHQEHIVRKIETGEWRKYKKIRLEALKSDPQAFLNSYEEESVRTNDDWKSIVESAFVGNNTKLLVGIDKNIDELLAIGGAYAENNQGEWNIVSIYVSPEHRNQGIGRALMEKIIKIMKSREDARKLVLHANVAQKVAVHLYQSLGFKAVLTVKNQILGDGRPHDVYEMTLDI